MSVLPGQLAFLFGGGRGKAATAESRAENEALDAPENVFDTTTGGEVGAATNADTEGLDETVITRGQMTVRAQALAFRLSADLSVPVRLSVTDNRSTMVSFRRLHSSLRLRLHHMFLDAPDEVIRALADYAGRGRPKAGNVLDSYIRGQQPKIRKERGAGAALNPRGRCFDLQPMFDRLNAEFFENAIQAKIGWGRMPGGRRRKSIRLGVYDHTAKEIRIHPALDRPEVPAYFVEFIVYHEMLHQLFPSLQTEGRRTHHPKAFRAREKLFPHYALSLRWERENLSLLLRR